jgi:hypothetical protein
MAKESNSSVTTDHDEIKEWVESREGRPAVVRTTHDTAEGGGLLRIDFGEQDENLQEISWNEFFKIFDENDLAFLYQEVTAEGDESRFNKFVSRDEVDNEEEDDAEEEDSDDA